VRNVRYDDRNSDRWSEVDRARAEEIARSLGTELPSEPELHRICGEPAYACSPCSKVPSESAGD